MERPIAPAPPVTRASRSLISTFILILNLITLGKEPAKRVHLPASYPARKSRADSAALICRASTARLETEAAWLVSITLER